MKIDREKLEFDFFRSEVLSGQGALHETYMDVVKAEEKYQSDPEIAIIEGFYKKKMKHIEKNIECLPIYLKESAIEAKERLNAWYELELARQTEPNKQLMKELQEVQEKHQDGTKLGEYNTLIELNNIVKEYEKRNFTNSLNDKMKDLVSEIKKHCFAMGIEIEVERRLGFEELDKIHQRVEWADSVEELEEIKVIENKFLEDLKGDEKSYLEKQKGSLQKQLETLALDNSENAAKKRTNIEERLEQLENWYNTRTEIGYFEPVQKKYQKSIANEKIEAKEEQTIERF